ncbi:activator of basal transcription 1-like [Myxocyprinus asiaticus]|uniref:activator of basal transcription 1-like n=1 Tax=Myxocyprinus asiaticus TaxID=70543 RepID=UPI002221F1FD|nr:activator of basal transcription 1-like [Myxocyprinus asiaticus]
MITTEELNDPKPEEEEAGDEDGDGDGDDDDDDDKKPEHDEDADHEMNSENGNETLELEINKEDGLENPKGKKFVPGIVYLAHIPPRMRPKHVRNMLGLYGEIGRIFLQPEDHCVKRKKKKAGSNSSSFTEGWVEFRDKRIAKRVATSLHNTPMANRKRSRFSSDLWSIKYLHRFQWCHLSERLAYEQTVYHQRMRTEISQAKRETNFYLASVEKSQNMAKLKKKKEKKGEVVEEKTWDFKQRPTEDEIQMKHMMKKGLSKKNLQKAQEKNKAIQEKAQSNVSLLAKIFNSGRALD